jgi:hypothetical protein
VRRSTTWIWELLPIRALRSLPAAETSTPSRGELQLRDLYRCGNISTDSRFPSPFKQKKKNPDAYCHGYNTYGWVVAITPQSAG